MVAAFGAAARRAREAGFDAVQVHGAHAYLLSQFLSPHTNRRKDQWGWELGGRLHLHLATLAAIREQVGPDYPVMIKLGVADAIEGGLPLKDGLEAARRLAQAGYDCLEISQGLRGEGYSNAEFRPEDRHAGQEGYFCDWAGAVKQRVSVPVIAVGGLRTPQACAQVLERNQADLVALCRPLISEPDLPARWQGRRPEPLPLHLLQQVPGGHHERPAPGVHPGQRARRPIGVLAAQRGLEREKAIGRELILPRRMAAMVATPFTGTPRGLRRGRELRSYQAFMPPPR